MCQDQCHGKTVFELLEVGLRLLVSGPLFSILFFRQFHEGSCYSGVVQDESSVEVGEAQEGLDLH